MPLSSTKDSGLMLQFLKVSGCGTRSSRLWGELWICQWAPVLNAPLNGSYRIKLSCTADPNMYSLGVLACVYLHDMPSSLHPSASPYWAAPSWTPVDGFQRMSVPVWSTALLFGELPRGGGVGGKKRLDLVEKKTLFIYKRNKTATPGGKQLQTGFSLWQQGIWSTVVKKGRISEWLHSKYSMTAIMS